jgi:hypothetical protein
MENLPFYKDSYQQYYREVLWSPTLSAEKSGKDGAQGLVGRSRFLFLADSCGLPPFPQKKAERMGHGA